VGTFKSELSDVSRAFPAPPPPPDYG